MNLRLGNLSVRQFAERVGAQIEDIEIQALEDRRTNEAQFTDPSKFHIFDAPAISIVVGAECFRETRPLWEAINRRQPFNRGVSFYLVESQERDLP